ncbi:MAG: metallophosphoesterase [Solirubrobacterales bacterium]|nr:metallophosphoesterase [Solirubrobacterales bacterium]
MASESRATARAVRTGELTSRPRRRSALEQVLRRASIVPDERFVAFPAPTGAPPYRRRLADVIGPDAMASIARAGRMRFHAVGDTGGHIEPGPQRRVAAAMAAELRAPDPARFFYHLGDIVYPHGEEANYRAQFLGAYADYAAPIFAIPGNHDAESTPSLESFVNAFCTETPPLHDAGRPSRPPADQPHVYWTLTHDWVWIVGLYSNVPEGGQFEREQLDWMIGELRAAPREAVVILALHQPVYSTDITHGSNLDLADALDECWARAGRRPDAVFTGHAHSYQRFARRVGDRSVPHIVAGAGGHHELHPVDLRVPPLPAAFPALPGVTLEAVVDDAHGFMTVTVAPGGATVEYTAVGRDGVQSADVFTIGSG